MIQALAMAMVWAGAASWAQTGCTPNSPPAPVITPGNAVTHILVHVTLSNVCSGKIFYTTDGSDPTELSTVYTGPLTLTRTTTLKAVAQASLSGVFSTVANARYTLLTDEIGSGTGFPPGRVQLNGGATLDGNFLKLTSNTVPDEASSAFTPVPVDVRSFTTDFTIDYGESPLAADGLMFVIQNQGPAALGAYGIDLGYGGGASGAGIRKSVGVKWDFYDNVGEGSNSTGLYTNGARPTLPAIDLGMQNSEQVGFNLNASPYAHVHMTYDGTTLVVTTLNPYFPPVSTQRYTVDIPAIVGGSTAYVGFTASTGGLKTTQEVYEWGFNSGPPVAPPVFSVPGDPYYEPTVHTYGTPQTVSVSSATPGATIYYTNDQYSAPASSSPVYTSPFLLGQNTQTTFRAIAVLNGVASQETRSIYFITPAGTVNDTAGFTAGSVALNGGAAVSGNRLRLTNGGANQAGSAFNLSQVGDYAFTTDFTFQLTNPGCCGIAFAWQRHGLNAVGGSGSNLGLLGLKDVYGNVDALGIGFALRNTANANVNATGPVGGLLMDLTPAGLDLRSGHPFHVHITTDGSRLMYRTTDTVTQASALNATAYSTLTNFFVTEAVYVGFTGSTDSPATATQDILSWSYNVGTPVSPPTISPAPGSFHASTVTLADITPGATIYYTLDGTEPTTSSTLYTGPLTIGTGNTKVTAIAVVGGVASQQVSGTYTSSLIAVDQSGGFAPGALRLNGSATLNGSALQLTSAGMTNQAASAFVTAPVNVQSFMTDFDFQVTNAGADGFMFVVQGQGPTALGGYGVNLGYGGATPITKSVGVKFDLYSNAGEGSDSTGIYLNGAQPALPATDLTASGLLLNSGHVLHAHVVYNGTVLAVTLGDALAQATTTQYYTVDIPTTVGGKTAYVGFTGGSGGLTATQQILNWSYNAP